MLVRSFAYFGAPTNLDPSHRVRLTADVQPPSAGDANGHVLTRRILFYGDSGDRTVEELEKDAHLLGSLPRPPRLPSTELFEPASWSSGWLDAPLTAAPASYTLLVCGTFEVWGPNGIESQTEKVLEHFKNIVLSPRTKGTEPGGGGSTTSMVTATGCFFGTQHLAMYDVTVEYTPPTNFHVSKISIGAGPAPNSVTNLTQIANPSPGDSPMQLRLQGHWDGSNTWYLVAVISFAPDSGAGTQAPDTHTITFTGMTYDSGTLIAGD
jgi:hypothetical protein